MDGRLSWPGLLIHSGQYSENHRSWPQDPKSVCAGMIVVNYKSQLIIHIFIIIGCHISISSSSSSIVAIYCMVV